MLIYKYKLRDFELILSFRILALAFAHNVFQQPAIFFLAWFLAEI